MGSTEQGDVLTSAVPVDAPVSAEIQKAVAEATGEFHERMRSNEEEMSKALLRIQDQEADQGGTQEGKPKGWFNDPFSLLDSVGMGYRSNPSAVTYETLRQMVERDTLLSAIVLTRIRQVSAFCRPQENKYSVGFAVRPRGRDKQYGRLSDEMKARCSKVERFITNMGVDYNIERDGLSKFMAKVVRDRLTYDQVCSVAGTKVELADGTSVNIEDVQAGMRVRTHKGSVREVIHPTQRLYEGEMVHVKSRGQSLDVTAGHPLFVARRTSHEGWAVELGEPTWVPAGEVTPGMYLTYPIPKLKEEVITLPIFDDAPRRFITGGSLADVAQAARVHKDTAYLILAGLYKKNGPAVARVLNEAERLGVTLESRRVHEPTTEVDTQWGTLLGFYLAEGHCTSTGVAFTFHEDEQEYVDFVVNFGQQLGVTATLAPYPDRQGITVILNSVALKNFLLEHVGTGSSVKRVPEFMLRAPRDVKDDFLAAYLKGDGHFNSLGNVKLSTTSFDIFSGLRVLFASNKIYLSCVTAPPFRDGWSVQYIANFSGPYWRAFAERTGLPYKTPPRENSRYIVSGDYLCVKVSKVSKYQEDCIPVYNMEVEEDHSYIANGFVNHNCFEKVPTYGGKIHSVYAHDASTFRIAQPKNLKGTPIATRSLNSSVQYVQIVNGERVTQYTPAQLAFCVANPRTSLRAQGYGFAEPMMLMNTITAHIWAEDWNRKAFSQGSTIKGVMNLKGNVPRQQYEAFKRQWSAQVAGVNNAWRTPILNSDGVEFTPVQMSNTEMGYQAWIEYLVKIACAIYQMDPTEINFDLRGGSGQQPVFMSSNEAQQEVSKDRGLKPLLRFFEDEFNRHIVWCLDEDLEFAFVGLDAKTEEQSIELRQKQSMTTHTLNEARALEDLPPVEDGDVVMNPTYTGYLQQKAMLEQQGGGAPEGGAPAEDGEDQQQPYADNMQGAEPGEEEEKAKNKLANVAPDETLSADEHLKNLQRNDWAASIHASLFDDTDLKKSAIDDDLNFDLIDL